jgi:hypothetical protein
MSVLIGNIAEGGVALRGVGGMILGFLHLRGVTAPRSDGTWLNGFRNVMIVSLKAGHYGSSPRQSCFTQPSPNAEEKMCAS